MMLFMAAKLAPLLVDAAENRSIKVLADHSVRILGPAAIIPAPIG